MGGKAGPEELEWRGCQVPVLLAVFIYSLRSSRCYGLCAGGVDLGDLSHEGGPALSGVRGWTGFQVSDGTLAVGYNPENKEARPV